MSTTSQTPRLIYFYPYEDKSLMKKQKGAQDHVCCVMASDTKEAINKTKVICNNHGMSYIKIMGMGQGKEEWVNETDPLRELTTGPQNEGVRNRMNLSFLRK